MELSRLLDNKASVEWLAQHTVQVLKIIAENEPVLRADVLNDFKSYIERMPDSEIKILDCKVKNKEVRKAYNQFLSIDTFDQFVSCHTKICQHYKYENMPFIINNFLGCLCLLAIKYD